MWDKEIIFWTSQNESKQGLHPGLTLVSVWEALESPSPARALPSPCNSLSFPPELN